jgi:hypothetical protein
MCTAGRIYQKDQQTNLIRRTCLRKTALHLRGLVALKRVYSALEHVSASIATRRKPPLRSFLMPPMKLQYDLFHCSKGCFKLILVPDTGMYCRKDNRPVKFRVNLQMGMECCSEIISVVLRGMYPFSRLQALDIRTHSLVSGTHHIRVHIRFVTFLDPSGT